MVTYTWDIIELSTVPQLDNKPDVVVNAFWSLTGTDGDYFGIFRSVSNFTLDTSKEFTPFESLTEEEVVSWVQATITETRLDIIKNDIISQIENSKNSVINPQTQPLPWTGA